ncbi:glutathione peroxidase [Deltaproteobacteria bacterium]|nr:glutathione peroxidase [Deltaproteobacteria bacterium]
MLIPLLLACLSPVLPGGTMSPPASAAANPAWYADLPALDGAPLASDAVAGKVVLIVNVASKCGFTPQYEGLEKLHQTYKDRGFTVLGAPSNQFGGQEPGAPAEIASFCKLNYGVTFPLLAKQEVKGPGKSKLYAWLEGSGVGGGSSVKWNFEKFLVARDGRVLARWRSFTGPDSKELVAAIERALAE